jgi:hypothetical protein
MNSIKLTEREAKKIVSLRTYRAYAHAPKFIQNSEKAKRHVEEDMKKLEEFIVKLSQKYNFQTDNIHTIYDDGTITFKTQ